jgi:hypothetical protein
MRLCTVGDEPVRMAYSTREEIKCAYSTSIGKSEGMRVLARPRHGGRVMLKWVLKE